MGFSLTLLENWNNLSDNLAFGQNDGWMDTHNAYGKLICEGRQHPRNDGDFRGSEFCVSYDNTLTSALMPGTWCLELDHRGLALGVCDGNGLRETQPVGEGTKRSCQNW